MDTTETSLLAEIEALAVENVPQRDETGKFLPGNEQARNPNGSPAKRVAALLRKKLALAGTDKPALERVIDNVIAVATNPNPKYSKEVVWAANFLFDRAFGQAMKSEEELDALRASGVQIAIISVPGQPTQITTSMPKALIAPEYTTPEE